MRDSSHFETKIAAHLPAAYNLARWLTRSDVDAEDVMQESLVKAFRFFDQVQSPEIKTWFFQIVRNTSYSWLKKNRNFTELTEDATDHVEDGAASPEENLLNSCTVVEIQNAIASLAPEHKEILILREFEELSYSEISRVMEIPEGTVMSRISRAREKLKCCLLESRKRGRK